MCCAIQMHQYHGGLGIKLWRQIWSKNVAPLLRSKSSYPATYYISTYTSNGRSRDILLFYYFVLHPPCDAYIHGCDLVPTTCIQTSHAKGEQDGEGGQIKSACTLAVGRMRDKLDILNAQVMGFEQRHECCLGIEEFNSRMFRRPITKVYTYLDATNRTCTTFALESWAPQE